MFKVDDKVVLTNVAKWYGGALQKNEECVVTRLGVDSLYVRDPVIWVTNTKGVEAAIYTSWASKSKPKNQQLLFSFMEG